MQTGGKRATTLSGWGDRTKVPPIPDEPRKARGKKDTRRWCLGRPGREHSLAWVKRFPWGPPYWMEHRCMNCQKVLTYCSGFFRECAGGHSHY